MAVAVLSAPASMTAEQYHRITEHLDASRTGPPPGRRFHACFGHGDHLMVFDVWDSPEELDAFTATLMPILAIEHIDMAPPEPLEIHDLVDGGDSRRAAKDDRRTSRQGLLHPPDREARSTASRASPRRTRTPTKPHQRAMTRRPSIGPPGTWPSHRTSSACSTPTVPSQSARAEPTWHRCGRSERSPRWRSRSRWWSRNATCNHHLDREGGQLMVKVGDRIRLSSTKGPDRDGVVTAVTGSLLRVRWPSEEETTVAPAPGTLTVLAASDAVKETAPRRRPPARSQPLRPRPPPARRRRPTTPGRERRRPNDHRADQRSERHAPGARSEDDRSARHDAPNTRQEVRPRPVWCVRCAQRPMTRRRNPHARRPPHVESRSIGSGRWNRVAGTARRRSLLAETLELTACQSADRS